MRILSCYYMHKPGGFCGRLYRLLNCLSRRGHQVLFLTLDEEPAQHLGQIELKKIPFPIKARQGLFFWTLFGFICPLVVLFEALKFRPDRIVVFGPFYAVMAGLAKLIGVPVILFLRAGLSYHERNLPLKGLLLSLSDRAGFFVAQKIVCLSKTMAAEAGPLLRGQATEILPNDLPAAFMAERQNLPLVPGRITALCSGLFVESKNLSLLLKAAAFFHERYGNENFKLRIAGTGPALDRMKKQLEACPAIELLGWQTDMQRCLSQADLFLFPSLGEGMPNSVLEALAAGIPVLASDIPVLREMLQDPELLFNPLNPTDITIKLETLVQNPEKLAGLAEKCRKRAREYQFDWDSRAEAIVTK